MQDSVMPIPLLHGLSATIDRDNYEAIHTVGLPNNLFWSGRICDHHWFAKVKSHTSYVVTKLSSHIELALHRVVLDAKQLEIVDHRDGNGLNNCRSNLRIATCADNARNRRVNRATRTGYKGVAFHKETGKYEAYIRVDRKKHHLGLFATAEMAAHAYDRRAIEAFGEFAALNFSNALLTPNRPTRAGAAP